MNIKCTVKRIVFAKYCCIIFVIMFSFVSYKSFAGLTVTANGSNGTCTSNAIITAVVSGNAGIVNYELIDLSTSLVIRNYQGNNIFSNLPAGQYKVQVQDATTSDSAQSNAVVLTSSYSAMNVSVSNAVIGCSANTGIITVTVTGGKSAFSFATISGPVTALPQISNTFNNLPTGTYTIQVTDGCGVSMVVPADVSIGTSTTTNKIVPKFHQNDPYGGGAFVMYGKSSNSCTGGAFVDIGGGWGYLGSATMNLSGFDQNHFSWRYIYPTGSDNIYGAGGILNAAPVSCSNNYLEMPASAAYPYAFGDLIIYDECGDSTLFKNYIQPLTNINTSYYGYSSRGGYDCIKGGSMNVCVSPYNLVCLPVYWTFTDQTSGIIIKDTAFGNNAGNYISFYGFTPGHTYTITATDALGHNAAKNASAIVPGSSNAIAITAIDPDYNLLKAGFPKMQFPYTLPDGTTYYYTVISSSTGNPAIGYTNSYTVSSTGNTLFSDPSTPNIYGPNSDGSWPSGTYTISVTASGCINSTLSFTISGLNALLNGESIVPACGGINNLIAFATLDNPSIYGIKILPGSSSNVGEIRTFGSSTIPGNYSCSPFNGLTYGTYNIGLITTATSNGTGGNPLATNTFNYDRHDTIVIDALTTRAYICAGNSTGSLIVAAYSSTGSSLQYSKDSGVTWQISNIFTGLVPGTYPLAVKDNCGNTVMYNASVVQASGISINISNDTLCVGSNLQLNVNAVGAIAYNWTGPNGFTSLARNPTINNVQTGNMGTYSVTVTTAYCTNTSSINVIVNASQQVLPLTGTNNVCSGSATQLSDATPGGLWSTSDSSIAIVDQTGKVRGLSAGTSIISYLITNVSGCSAKVILAITVNALPAVPPILGYNLTGICKGEVIQLSDSLSGGAWSSNNLLIATIDGNGKVSGLDSGKAIISYTVSNLAGCLKTVTQNILVNICKVIGLAKNLDDVKPLVDGSYNVAFTFVVQNVSPSVITNVSVTDNLVNTFTTAMKIKPVSLSCSGSSLLVNPNYTGTGADTSMLLPTSILAPLQTDSIHLLVNINPQNINGIFYNTAYGTALYNATVVASVSVNGLNILGNPSSTPIVFSAARLHIPGGFSPNNDGVNDKFVIGNASNYHIHVEMYNRWGNKVYESKGYYQNDWDGRSNQPGQLFDSQLPDGTYYYVIEVFDKQTNTLLEKPVGFITIKR